MIGSRRAAELTIVVVFYNMRREAARTLYALSAANQRNVDPAQYRVIAVDNASTKPLDPEFVASFGANFSYERLQHSSKSPAVAANHGVKKAESECVALIVDGARMPSPGIVARTLEALRIYPEPLVGALAWHLGPPSARVRRSEAYDQAVEDQLLEQFDWRGNGYELFRHSSLAKPSRNGFLGGLPRELSYLAMRRSAFLELGGLDEAFASPGGGQVNHDFLKRAVESGRFSFVMLLGEGVFHQYHGGASTGTEEREELRAAFDAEYRRLRGTDYAPFDQPEVTYFGSIGPEARPFVHRDGKKLLPTPKVRSGPTDRPGS